MDSDRLAIYRITDFITVLSILDDPIIDGDINEDGFRTPFPNVIDEFWIGIAELGSETFACFRVHQLSRHVWQVHAFVLPSYRNKYSVIAANMAKEWAWKNIPELKTLITVVPSCHPNVIYFVRKMGFKLVGKLENCYTKNKKVEDLLIFSTQE